MKLGWGLIGPGLHADLRVLPAICQSSSSELIGICHYNKEKADFYAQRYGTKRSYTTIEEMLDDPEIQVVDVATPEPMHKEHVVKAAQAGKHVRCEIPMAVTVEECQEMVAACQKAEVKLATGFAWAQHPAHIEMRNRIQSGSIGEINFVEGQYNFLWGGGLLGGQTYWKIPPRTPISHSNSMSWKHDPSYKRRIAIQEQGLAIYVLRYLLGREVEEVMAFADPSGLNKSIACLKFSGDVYGFALGSGMFPYGNRSIIVYGTEGRMTGVDTMAWSSDATLEVLKLRSEEAIQDKNTMLAKSATSARNIFFEGKKLTEKIEYCGANMWVDTIDAFNKCIQEGGDPVPSGIDGLRERQIFWAITESSTTGKAVKLPKD